MEISAENTRTWQAKAAWWDELHGDEGNAFHRTVVGPPVEALLAVQVGERVLDIACGSGQLARRLAHLGAQVVAVDGAAAFLPLAAQRAQSLPAEVRARLVWHSVDATDEEALAALGEGTFDAIVSTMALMDIPDIAPMHRAAARLLRPGGRFVVAVAHPCFNHAGVTRIAEMADLDGHLQTRMRLQMGDYLTPRTRRAAGAQGEPAPHYDFHRPLRDLLAPAFAAGFLLDGMEESAFPPGSAGASPFAWQAFSDIPPVLAYRLRKLR